MKRISLFLFMVWLLPCAVACADAPIDLDWLQGRWCSESSGERIEELWLAPVGGETVGISRTTRDGAMSGFEYMRISYREDSLYFMAQPGGRPAVLFKAVEHGSGWVRFENPEHDFPQQIDYHRDGQTLVGRIAGPGDDGATVTYTFNYTPCD